MKALPIRKYKRDILVSILPALILSVTQVLGWTFVHKENYIDLHSPFLYLAIIIFTVIFMALLVCLGRLLPMFGKWITHHEPKWIGGKSDKEDESGFWRKLRGKEFLIFALILIILYIPPLLAMWPGLYAYDAPKKLMYFFDQGFVTSHYPVLHTLFLAACSKLGQAINGTYEMGVLIHSILQCTVMVVCFAYTLKWIYRNYSKWIAIFGLLFLGLNPLIQIMIFTTTHDVIFGGVLLVVLVKMLDIAKKPDEFFAGTSKMVGFSLLLLLMCLLRNQGIYMLILALPFVIAAAGRRKAPARQESAAGSWKAPKDTENNDEPEQEQHTATRARHPRIKTLIIWVAPIILTLIITGPIYNAAGVVKGNVREMLSVPIQQICYTIYHSSERIAPEQYETLYKYLPPEVIEQYNPCIADPVKDNFISQDFEANPKEFIKLWAKIGLNNPSCYLSSLVGSGYGYYYPGKTAYYERFIVYDGTLTNIDSHAIKRSTKFPLYDNYLRAISIDAPYDNIPIVGFLLSQALPFLLMVIGFYTTWRRKRPMELVSLILPLGYWGTLLLGPVIGIRYVFPLIIMVPVLLGLILQGDNT